MQALFKRFKYCSSEREYRDRALLHLISSTGLRAREVVSLRFSARITTPDGAEGFRYVRKGGAVLITLPSKRAIKYVQEYHKKIGVHSDLFFLSLPTNIRRIRNRLTTRTLQRIVDTWKINRADGRKASPHSFRHTVGQKMFLKAGSIAAQKVLGHTSPVTTSKFYTLPYYDGSRHLVW